MFERLSKLLTDTLIISGFLVFSYAILMLYKLAYFESFGITSISSLIVLDFQSVFQSLLTTVVLAVFALILFLTVMRIRRALINKAKNKFWVLVSRFITGFATSVILITPASLLMATAFPNHTKIVVIISILVMIIFAFSLTRGSKEPAEGSINGSVYRFVDKIEDRLQVPFMLVVLFVMLTFFYALILGYLSPMTSKDLTLTKHDGKNYVVIDYTSNRVVLAQLEGSKILPIYKYINLSDSSVLEVYKANQRLDFNMVSSLSESKLKY